MPNPKTTKPNPKAVWLKELHSGEEGSVWRVGAEIIDEEIRTARKMLDKAGVPFTARDLVRLSRVLFEVATVSSGLCALAKARLDCEGIAYDAADLIEMVALLADGMDRMADVMDEAEAEHAENCPECAGQARH